MLLNEQNLMDSGWEKFILFEGVPGKHGMISEHQASCLFEGDYKKTDGSRVLEGIFQRANTKNKNGRIYTEAILGRETKNMMETMKEAKILGELDHPETVNVNMRNACLRLEHLAMDRNGIVGGRMTLLPTLPLGEAAIGCCDALEGKPGVSSRGSGSIFKKGDDQIVGEDYKMRTYDIIHDPSTPGARPSVVSESLIREFQEFCSARPSTRQMTLAGLVDRYLGIK
jgi:prohead core protein serine protease